MKNIILVGFLLLFISNSIAQDRAIKMRYVGYKFNESKNISFVNEELIFLKGNDTIIVNIKRPFDIDNPILFNIGIYYNCHLKEDSIYTIILKKICVNEIPEICNSYYKVNAIFDKNDCFKFIEVEKHTPYEYICGDSKGYGKFVDIKGILHEIVGLKPDNDCFYP